MTADRRRHQMLIGGRRARGWTLNACVRVMGTARSHFGLTGVRARARTGREHASNAAGSRHLVRRSHSRASIVDHSGLKAISCIPNIGRTVAGVRARARTLIKIRAHLDVGHNTLVWRMWRVVFFIGVVFKRVVWMIAIRTMITWK